MNECHSNSRYFTFEKWISKLQFDSMNWTQKHKNIVSYLIDLLCKVLDNNDRKLALRNSHHDRIYMHWKTWDWNQEKLMR